MGLMAAILCAIGTLRKLRLAFATILLLVFITSTYLIRNLNSIKPQLKPMSYTIANYFHRLQDFIVYGNTVQESLWYESRHVALRILDLIASLKSSLVIKRPISYRDLHELQRIILDLNSSAQFPAMAIQSPAVTCPEVYLGPQPAQGWKVSNCTLANTWQELVTVVINLPTDKIQSGQGLQLLEDFNVSYPTMPVIVAGFNGSLTARTYRTLLEMHPSKSAARSLNEAFEKVRTPFTLMTQGMLRFTHMHSNLERSLRVLTEVPGVAAVGGALKNASSYWKIGCFQSHLTANGGLTYQWGYHRSQSESMYCDYVDGPFLAHTKVLQRYRMDENLEFNVIFQDFFLRLRDEWLAMATPDVMFYADGHMMDSDRHGLSLSKNWKPFAIKWGLKCISINFKNTRVASVFSTNVSRGALHISDSMQSDICQ